MAEQQKSYPPDKGPDRDPEGIAMDDLEIRPLGDGLYVITNTSKGATCCSCWSCSNRAIAAPTGATG